MLSPWCETTCTTRCERDSLRAASNVWHVRNSDDGGRASGRRSIIQRFSGCQMIEDSELRFVYGSSFANLFEAGTMRSRSSSNVSVEWPRRMEPARYVCLTAVPSNPSEEARSSRAQDPRRGGPISKRLGLRLAPGPSRRLKATGQESRRSGRDGRRWTCTPPRTDSRGPEWLDSH